MEIKPHPKINGMTESQAARFAKAVAKLPKGYHYHCHCGCKGYASVYGVSLFHEGKNDAGGYVNQSMQAHVSSGHDEALQRLLLNRVAAALWHKQPDWGSEPVKQEPPNERKNMAKKNYGKLKAVLCVQANGPCYWIVSTGKWKAPVIATCENEDDAKLLAQAPELQERNQFLEQECKCWRDITVDLIAQIPQPKRSVILASIATAKSIWAVLTDEQKAEVKQLLAAAKKG